MREEDRTSEIKLSERYDFYIKVGNTGPDLQVALLDEDGDSVNITNYSTIKFSMRAKRTGTVIIDAVAASEVSVNPGIIKYEWQAADTVTAGEYEGEFEVVMASGQIINFPNKGYISILISESI